MLLVITVTIILAFLIARHYRKVSKLPPGPPSVPIFENLHQLIYQGWKSGGVVSMFTHFRKQYGNIFTLWMGPFPYVNICDFEVAHEVFVKNGSKYADRFIPPLLEHMNGKGVFASNGENWQELRKFSMTTMRNMGMGKDLMEQKVLEELNARCAEIDRIAVNGVTTQHANSLFDLTVGSIINSILVGVRFEENNKEEFLTLKHMLDKSLDSVSMFEMILPVWVLQKFFPKRYECQVATQDNIKNFVSRRSLEKIESVKSGKDYIDPEDPQDLTEAFILKMQSEGDNPAYSIECLKCLLLDLWTTGQETTSTTLVSGFTQFMNNPKEMDNVREELMKVTDGGSRPLSLKDRNSTPYLIATINEIQRHASILNLNFYRINHELTTMGGHPVDGGTLVAAQLSALHENEGIFEDCHKFDPTRYIKNEKLGQQVIPYGLGKRSCLGESLAKAELYLIIGNLLLRYKFRPHGKVPSTADNAPYGFAKRPSQLTMDFVKI